MSDGAWIFLSHSHKDFDKVRALRNELEMQGHHPLLFFLKCLDDDSEIDELIRREIKARSWFILCDSPNSRDSRWVGDEREIIAKLPSTSHTSITVNLEDSLEAQLAAIAALTKRATVFLSYVKTDDAMAKRIEKSLREEDFGVFSIRDIRAGTSWQAEIESALNDAVDRGAVLVLLSRASMTSQVQRREIMLALQRADARGRRRNIVPIFLEPQALALDEAPLDMRNTLLRIQGFDFSRGEFAENMHLVKRWLRSFDWQA